MATANGTLAGQVVISGPLRNAAVSIDQIELDAKFAVALRAHVTDTVTDEDGRFGVEVGKFNGLFLLTASGGSFTDLATGAAIQLDSSATLETITPFELFDERDDVLVSPVGHLIAARTRWKVDQLGDIKSAQHDAAEHLDRHFGAVADWSHLKLGSLDAAATSPTEAVRSALVQAAWSFLAQDIAAAAGASPQEVNVLTLTRQLAADIGQAVFDGNDGNAPAPGSGLQVGVCPAVNGCDAQPPGGCALGSCRSLCDLYAGTPRALLAGEMTKVIQSPTLNHTGLVTSDILAVARAMSDDVDDDLFGSACVENLDRVPPRLEWIAPVPMPGLVRYVRGMLQVKVRAVDDTDLMPQVWIDDHASTNSTAEATIDTTAINGRLEVTAFARDIAGNKSMLALPDVIADNLVPTLTLASDGYFIDGDTWWTTTGAPPLGGTASDASPLMVIAATQAGTVNANVTGTTWAASLPAAIDLAGGPVTITAVDAAGNHTEVTQRIRADVTPPQLTFQPSIVNNEALEQPTFSNESPVHIHTGTAIDLADIGSCPAVTKFSYLLGANPPPYGSEIDDGGNQHRNPVHYVLVASDDGVGIAPGSTQYRVGFRTGNTTTWILDWTPAGAPSQHLPGVDQYDIDMFSDTIPQLATTEGIYDVQFRATDRLARTTTVARCFELHLRAPPLHFQFPGQGAPDPDPIPVDHGYRLSSLDLAPGALFTAVAARLLNNNASGASLIDEDVTNGTASTVYLDVAVTRPGTVFANRNFAVRFTTTTSADSTDCTERPGSSPPAICDPPDTEPVYFPLPSAEVSLTSLSFPVRVFELNGSLQPATEVPCMVCGIGDHWTFAIPPRPTGASGPLPPRRFKVMTMIGQVSVLWPSDGNAPATPPFADTALGGIAFTGQLGPTSTGCTTHNVRTLPNGTVLDTCTQVTSHTPYRVLTQASLRTLDRILSVYATAPTSMIAPAPVTDRKLLNGFTWSSAEGALP